MRNKRILNKRYSMNKLILSLLLFFIGFNCYSQTLPVKDPSEEGLSEVKYSNIRNLYSLNMLLNAIKGGDEDGLTFDITSVDTLIDGTKINPYSVYGTIYAGPYPFESDESDYPYKRFRIKSDILNGIGKIKITDLMTSKVNSEDWTDRGTLMVRIKLFLELNGQDRFLGAYDFPINFIYNGAYSNSPSIVEGPFVYAISSEDPSSIKIFYKTSKPTVTALNIEGLSLKDAKANTLHNFTVKQLNAGTDYKYYIDVNGIKTKPFIFKTAPVKGSETVSFAFTGDAREGLGGGENEFMGVNNNILDRLVNVALRNNVDFFIFGGDLTNGYTSSVDDFTTMLYAFKQTISPAWSKIPFYSVMGNHESLLKVFDNGKISLDRWPYNTESSESIFADNFFNPKNSPLPADNRRPSYKENVFSFLYGNIKVIGFNNNYWYSSNPSKFGGSPEGFIFGDQLSWIKSELDSAANDVNIKYIILLGQEPVIPNGGHITDAMWYNGNNNISAYTYKNGNLGKELKGIIDVRNEFISMVSSHRKVAAVLTSDEHEYYRILVNNKVPLGVPSKDDKNGNGIVCEQSETCSPLNVGFPTWFITSGGGGAPYYSEEATPWNKYVKNTNPSDYKFSSQYNILIFKETSGRLSLEVHNGYGQIIDSLGDLTMHK